MIIKTINNSSTTHENEIKRLIATNPNLKIAVAFLKMSGLQLLVKEIIKALKKEASIDLYIGLDFYLTEPNALKRILQLSVDHKKLRLYLCQKKQAAFHPKVYFANNSKEFSAIIGSANLTTGGLNNNFEFSTLIEGEVTSSTCRDIEKYFSSISTIAEAATPLTISQYKKKYDIYTDRFKRAEKESQKEINKSYMIDTKKLSRYVNEYLRDASSAFEWSKKRLNYKKAKAILDKLIDSDITSKREFMDLYNPLVGGAGTDKLWHSGSIFRSKNLVAQKYNKFISIISDIRQYIQSKKKPEEVFKNALHRSREIKGLGMNVLTEVMNTYEPNKYAVLNRNPLGALYELGFESFKLAQSFNENDYREFNNLMKDISKACNFNNLSQADHLCNFIYWKYVKKKP